MIPATSTTSQGQTEESFVNEVLAPHLRGVGYTNVKRSSARRMPSQRQRRGETFVNGVQVRTEIC